MSTTWSNLTYGCRLALTKPLSAHKKIKIHLKVLKQFRGQCRSIVSKWLETSKSSNDDIVSSFRNERKTFKIITVVIRCESSECNSSTLSLKSKTFFLLFLGCANRWWWQFHFRHAAWVISLLNCLETWIHRALILDCYGWCIRTMPLTRSQETRKGDAMAGFTWRLNASSSLNGSAQLLKLIFYENDRCTGFLRTRFRQRSH